MKKVFIIVLLIICALPNINIAADSTLARVVPGVILNGGRNFFTSFNKQAPSYSGWVYRAGFSCDIRLGKKGNWYITSVILYDRKFLIQNDEYPNGPPLESIGAKIDDVYNLRAEYLAMSFGAVYKSQKKIYKKYSPFYAVNLAPDYLVSMKEIIDPIFSDNFPPMFPDGLVINRMEYFMPWNFNIYSVIGLEREYNKFAIRGGLTLNAQLTEPQRPYYRNSGMRPDKKYYFKGGYEDFSSNEGKYARLRNHSIGVQFQFLLK